MKNNLKCLEQMFCKQSFEYKEFEIINSDKMFWISIQMVHKEFFKFLIENLIIQSLYTSTIYVFLDQL